MIGHVIRRLIASIVLLLALTLATFLIFKTIPLDPACLKVDCGQGSTATKAQLQAIDHQLGVDRPILVQYKDFIWSLARHGSFGSSWSNSNINETLRSGLAHTASILLGGVVFLLALAIPLGIISALRQNSALDRAILFGSIFGIALHPLIIGYLLRQIFGATLHVLPSSFYCTIAKPHIPPPPPGVHVIPPPPGTPGPCYGLGSWASHLVLPWLTFALFFLPLYIRLIRARVLETLGEPHVATARAKGASEQRVMLRHVLRPALIPLTPMVAMDLGGALMAAIYIEFVFSLGGIGGLVLGVLSPDRAGYDLPLVASLFFVIAAIIVLLNLIADIVQTALDPRVRLSTA